MKDSDTAQIWNIHKRQEKQGNKFFQSDLHRIRICRILHILFLIPETGLVRVTVRTVPCTPLHGIGPIK